MPLAWSELGDEDLRGAHFNLRNAVSRVHRQGDPWLRKPCKPQALGAAVLRRLERIAR
jgi:DNA primase